MLGRDPRELRAEVDGAGTGGQRPPRACGRSRRMRVRKRKVAHLHLHSLRRFLPAHVARRAVERNRLGEYPRELERHRVCGEFQRALRFRRLEASADAGRAGEHILRIHAEAIEFAARRELLRRFGGSLPCELAVDERAARRVARQIVAETIRQRQMRGERRQRREIEARKREVPLRRAAGLGFFMREREIGRGQRGAAGGAKLQCPGEQFTPVAHMFPTDAAGDVR